MPKVLTEVRDRIFIITINRPEVMNCIDGETAKLLFEAWQRFRDDDELFVAIITGAGEKSFCSGADLKNFQSLLEFEG
ncbi:MAG: enoyl-CoA hydratase-related protein, partial [Candidatus Hadarchaeales archaeon]